MEQLRLSEYLDPLLWEWEVGMLKLQMAMNVHGNIDPNLKRKRSSNCWKEK